MPARPHILVLNGTCLDVIDAHRDWLSELDATFDARPEFRRLEREELLSLLSEADGLVGPTSMPLSPGVLEQSVRLRAISLASSGYDSLDVDAISNLGIVITNAPAPELAEVVADLTWGLILAVSREIPLHDRLIRSGNTQRGIGVSPWRKVLGIVGLGMIGKAVVRRAQGFEMRVLASTRHPDAEFIERYGIELLERDEVLAKSDFVSLHARLSSQTHHMIAAREFGLLKPSAFLINTARRELLDEEALCRALQARQLAGAALDDPPSRADSPLLQQPNVVLTTHLGNRARPGVDAVFRLAINNMLGVLKGSRLPHTLNPQVYDTPPWTHRWLG